MLCSGGGWPDATIHGSRTDPLVVWVVRGNDRLRLAWDGTFIARFTPALEVVDDSGNVYFREGDAVSGGCETGEPGVWKVSR